MAYNNVVDVITLEEIVPRVVDTVLRTNELTMRVFRKTKDFGAATQDLPIKYQKGTAVQSFIGMDLLPTVFTDTRLLMKFNPRYVAVNVAIAGTDMMANNTAMKIIDLLAAEMDSRKEDLADSLGDMFWSDGTGNNNKDFYGLEALVDDGTLVDSIGGLSRSTYPTLQSSIINNATMSLNGLRTLFNEIGDEGAWPTVNITTFEGWQLFETLLQPQEKIYKETSTVADYKGYSGFNSLSWAGMEVVRDRKAPSGFWAMLNEDFLDFYALDQKLPVYEGKEIKVASKLFIGNQYEGEVENMGFQWTGFIKTTSQFAWNSFIIVSGNLLTANPRRHGMWKGIANV